MASRPPEHTGPVSDEAARNRWAVIQVMRMIGVGTVLLGIVLTRDVIDIAGERNHILGYVLIALGLGDLFVVPQVLARKWRTPRP